MFYTSGLFYLLRQSLKQACVLFYFGKAGIKVLLVQVCALVVRHSECLRHHLSRKDGVVRIN